MKSFCVGALALAAAIALALPARAQPPGDRGPGPGDRGPGDRGPGPGRYGRPPDGPPDGPPPGPRGGAFEPGKVLPPHIRDMLRLSEDQQDELDRLEKDVKARLMKILTPDQKRKLREMRAHGPVRDFDPGQREMRRGPGGPPPDGRRPGGPPGSPGPDGPRDRDEPPQ